MPLFERKTQSQYYCRHPKYNLQIFGTLFRVEDSVGEKFLVEVTTNLYIEDKEESIFFSEIGPYLRTSKKEAIILMELLGQQVYNLPESFITGLIRTDEKARELGKSKPESAEKKKRRKK